MATNENSQNQRSQALKSAISQIEKSYGKGSIMKLGDTKGMSEVDAISTGALALDVALGIGGLPKGRIIEIYGPESSGKTTLTLHAISECQKAGGTVAFIDAEHALDPVYAGRIGVDVDSLLLSQPDTGEQGLEITETLIRSGAVDLIVIDSVAALTPRAEIEGEMGDSHMGLQARLMSQALRKITGITSRLNCTIIFTNQIREKIGVMFGNPETTPGGRALKFYASVRMEIRRIESLTEGDVSTGIRVRVKVVKNKVAPPFRKAEFDIMFNEGISREGNVLDMAVEMNVIDKSGAWYKYNGENFAQGRESAKKVLKGDQKMLREVEFKVREILKKATSVPLEIGIVEEETPEVDSN
jgi:recombination protein RecA